MSHFQNGGLNLIESQLYLDSKVPKALPKMGHGFLNHRGAFENFTLYPLQLIQLTRLNVLGLVISP